MNLGGKYIGIFLSTLIHLFDLALTSVNNINVCH